MKFIYRDATSSEISAMNDTLLVLVHVGALCFIETQVSRKWIRSLVSTPKRIRHYLLTLAVCDSISVSVKERCFCKCIEYGYAIHESCKTKRTETRRYF